MNYIFSNSANRAQLITFMVLLVTLLVGIMLASASLAYFGVVDVQVLSEQISSLVLPYRFR